MMSLVSFKDNVSIDIPASNGHLTMPIKTLWYEFLLHPKLLEAHLNNDHSDPSAIELIVNFMTNASIAASTNTCSGPLVPNTAIINTNGNGDGGGDDECVSPTQLLQTQLTHKKDDIENKKSVTIKLLALKVASHLKWDFESLESLPVIYTDNLLNELNRFCEKNNAPSNCKLFACILYYRWILRCIIKSHYPMRGPKGPVIPFVLQQQIDPCFVSPEAYDCLIKNLQQQMEMAVNDLEKLVNESTKGSHIEIAMPVMECFTLKDNKCNWEIAIKLNTSEMIDKILYDLGRWNFFHENYLKSYQYFERISLTSKDKFKDLDDYLLASRELKDDPSDDIEIVDITQQINDIVLQMMSGHTCDISIFDNIIDVKEISDSIDSAYKNYSTDLQRVTLIRLTKYLSNRIKGLSDHLNMTIFNNANGKVTSAVINDDVEMIEEGEIEEIVADEEVKDPELVLLDATDPELIQSLVSKVQKHPLMINNQWSLPAAQTNLIMNIPQSQYEKCHIILAKAFQLRKAKLFIESRTLYLSLLEDVQASLPQLAEVIRLELLRTDLENHFESTDIDDRRIIDLIGKCERTLRTIDKNTVIEFPELTELCCVFLLESCPSALKDFSNSQVTIIKFASCLSVLGSDHGSKNVVTRSKEIWELLLSAFITSAQNNSKKVMTMITPSSMSVSSIISFVSKLKDLTLITIILSCLGKLLNVVRDYPALELTIPPSYSSFWPSSLGSISSSIDANLIASTLNILLGKFLEQRPAEINWIKFNAELSSIEGNFADAMKYFTLALMISTKYFTVFSNDYTDEDAIIHKMIHCCVKLGCHTQAAVLHQMTKEPNYGLSFKALSERNCNDSCDDLYECIWDITILEFLVNLHTRRGENERKTKAIQLIGQLELNSNNYDYVVKESADVRRGKLMRVFARSYL